MVKGVTRRVILVKAPDPKLFEQAIFIVREDALSGEGVSAEEVLRQAQAAADGYIRETRGWKKLSRLSGPLWGTLGALAASAFWCLGLLFL